MKLNEDEQNQLDAAKRELGIQQTIIALGNLELKLILGLKGLLSDAPSFA
ncbi:hypothetical protein L3556_14755 [Candidatus Synechococcus calcipolaris G9]|uniref:Uncharacterized protein n=1 Tax=Candidatus Synechococcus calcipolaris G9 TaxID=1497997 RepID=A0ABT6F2T7_9SYNE|nr:hypothetical protein [Candidatus Synechococcus calcipolaris]MDG2992178.1 hypothetical protein [Candidatus Synechococcus calcipolaris G9]